MPGLRIDTACRWLSIVFIGAPSVLSTLLSGVAWSASRIEVQTIRDAWTNRRGRITTFEYRCETAYTIIRGSRSNNNPFQASSEQNTPTPKEDTTLQSEFAFTMSNGRFAFVQETDLFDKNMKRVSPYRTAVRRTFDRACQKDLVMSGDPNLVGLGEIIHSHKPDFRLAIDKHLIAMWLAFHPTSHLKRANCDPDNMIIESLTAFRDGQDYIKLLIPRNNPSWQVFLYVDPSRGFVPAQYMMRYENTVRRDVRIHYVPDAEVGWRVGGWTDTNFDESGSIDTSLSGEVKRCSINEAIPDDAFSLQFPSGVHVREQDGDTQQYFISHGGGEREYIEEHQYGLVGLSEDRERSSIRLTLAALSGLLMIGCVLLFVWRRRKGANLARC